MIVDGFLDWATRVDGVADKIYSQPNSGQGIACHSVVGEESEFEDGIPNRFFDTTRLPNGRYVDAAAASVMFVLRKDGELIQMYDVTKSTWTSGGYEGNTSFWAIEAEGGLYPNYGEQLTPEAEATFIRLVTEWEAYSGLKAEPTANILQHRQIAAKYGYASTACASGRYDTAWSRIAAGERYDDMTAAEAEAIARKVFDEATPLYFIDLMKKYFCDVPVGDFSDMPDPEVVKAIAQFSTDNKSIPKHDHIVASATTGIKEGD